MQSHSLFHKFIVYSFPLPMVLWRVSLSTTANSRLWFVHLAHQLVSCLHYTCGMVWVSLEGTCNMHAMFVIYCIHLPTIISGSNGMLYFRIFLTEITSTSSVKPAVLTLSDIERFNTPLYVMFTHAELNSVNHHL